MMIQRISDSGYLSQSDLAAFVHQAFDGEDVNSKRLLFIIPDSTRSMPMPIVFRALFDALHNRVAKIDYLIALGTHPPMSEDAINKMLGVTREERATTFRDIEIFNHDWKNPAMLAHIGSLTEEQISEI